MRTVTAAIGALFSNSISGLHPVWILEIEWLPTIKKYYAIEEVTNLTQTVYPCILNWGNLTVSNQAENIYNFSDVTIDMSLHDSFTSCYRMYGLMEKTCRIYAHFINDTTYDLSDDICIFQGLLNAPTFNNNKVVSLNLTTFSYFKDIKQNPAGSLPTREYPIAFGTVTGVPAVQMPVTFEGIEDPGKTFPEQYDYSFDVDTTKRGFCLGIKENTIEVPSHDVSNGLIWNGSTFVNDPIETASDWEFAQLPKNTNRNYVIKLASHIDFPDLVAECETGTEYLIEFNVVNGVGEDNCMLRKRKTSFREIRTSFFNDSDRPASSEHTTRKILVTGKFIQLGTDYYFEIINMNPKIYPYKEITLYDRDDVSITNGRLDGTKAFLTYAGTDWTIFSVRLENRMVRFSYNAIALPSIPELFKTPDVFFITSFPYSDPTPEDYLTIELYPVNAKTYKYTDDVYKYSYADLWYSKNELATKSWYTKIWGTFPHFPDEMVSADPGQQGLEIPDGYTEYNKVFAEYSPYGVLKETSDAHEYFFVYDGDVEGKKWSKIVQYTQPDPDCNTSYNRSAADYYHLGRSILFYRTLITNVMIIDEGELGDLDAYWGGFTPPTATGTTHPELSKTVILQFLEDWGINSPYTNWKTDIADLDFLIPSAVGDMSTYLSNRIEGAEEFLAYLLVDGVRLLESFNFIWNSDFELNKITVPKGNSFRIAGIDHHGTPPTGEEPPTGEYIHVFNLVETAEVTRVFTKKNGEGDAAYDLSDEEDYNLDLDIENQSGLDGIISSLILLRSLPTINAGYQGVYLNFKSTLSNNPVDVIRFLIDGKYWNGTDYISMPNGFSGFMPNYTCDESTFSTIRCVYRNVAQVNGNHLISDTTISIKSYAIDDFIVGDEVWFEGDTGTYEIISVASNILTISPGLRTNVNGDKYVRVTGHPKCNFALLDTKNVLNVVNDVAKMCLCILVFGGEEIKIRYTGTQAAYETFGGDAIYLEFVQDSVKYSVEDRSTMLTGITFEYQRDYSKEFRDKVKVERTVSEPNETTIDCYVFTDGDSVKMINNRFFNRRSYDWLTVEFETHYIAGILVEFYDAFMWVHEDRTLQTPFTNTQNTVFGQVTSIQLDMMNFKTTLKMLLARTINNSHLSLLWDENYSV